MKKKITLNDWLKKWFSLYSKPNVKHSTAVSYECYIRKHIIPEIRALTIEFNNYGQESCYK